MDSSAAGSAVLVVGGTGYIGRFVAEAAIASGLTTFVLVRPFHGRACPSRLAALRHRGAIILEGSAADREFVEKTLRENGIDVVVSAVGGGSILDQLSLLDAVRAAGTVKRFLPSEFGHDIDRANPVEPGLSFYKEKRRIRRAVEAAAVPYTYICCNSIAGWPYHDNTHPSEALPPVDRFVIYGDGSVRAYFVAGCDIGKFTIRAAFDPRTLNKSVHFRPTCNFINLNEMASLWETKIGFTLPRIKLSEHDLLALAQENNIPRSIVAALTHDIFINGCQSNYSIDGANDVDISCLFPDTEFRTIDDCFTDYLAAINPINNVIKSSSPPSSAAAIANAFAVPAESA